MNPQKVYYEEGGLLVKESGNRDNVVVSVNGGWAMITPEDAIFLGQKILGAGLDARENQRRKAREEVLRRGVQPDVEMPPYVSDEDSAFRLTGGVPEVGGNDDRMEGAAG